MYVPTNDKIDSVPELSKSRSLTRSPRNASGYGYRRKNRSAADTLLYPFTFSETVT